jgi:hypothetical protein
MYPVNVLSNIQFKNKSNKHEDRRVFKTKSVKLRMMTGVLMSAIHNSSSKGHKQRRRNKCACVFNLSIPLLLWKDKINTEINASVELLA